MPESTEKLDLATRAAWLYYVAGDTQNEIAEKLQISRPVAQRLVAFAVEKTSSACAWIIASPIVCRSPSN